MTESQINTYGIFKEVLEADSVGDEENTRVLIESRNMDIIT